MHSHSRVSAVTTSAVGPYIGCCPLTAAARDPQTATRGRGSGECSSPTVSPRVCTSSSRRSSTTSWLRKSRPVSGSSSTQYLRVSRQGARNEHHLELPAAPTSAHMNHLERTHADLAHGGAVRHLTVLRARLCEGPDPRGTSDRHHIQAGQRQAGRVSSPRRHVGEILPLLCSRHRRDVLVTVQCVSLPPRQEPESASQQRRLAYPVGGRRQPVVGQRGA